MSFVLLLKRIWEYGKFFCGKLWARSRNSFVYVVVYRNLTEILKVLSISYLAVEC